jgi:hypothetical protein
MDDILRQRGFINFGGGLDGAAWVAKAELEGFIVRDCGEYAELWDLVTQAERSSGK